MSRGKQASFLSRRRGGQHLHLPFDREGLGVAVGLAGELHVGATDVPVVVIANDGHLRRVWREEPTAEGRGEPMQTMGYGRLTNWGGIHY